MKRIIAPERMRAAEAAFMRESGTPSIELMERAARAIASELNAFPGGALFLCGPGNNGGDGYAAARLLHERQRKTIIWSLCAPEALSGDAYENMLRCKRLQIPIHRVDAAQGPPPAGCAVVVDALFGTGLARPLSGLYAEAARWVNACGLPVLSVDMPSGTEKLLVRADVTVTFHRMKPCHLLFPGRESAGRIVIADIGLPDDAFPDDLELLEDQDIPRLLPKRVLDAHKGTCGHALVVAGSYGMAGAAALCANGALRGGAGLVTVLCPPEIMGIVQTLAPCAMCVTPDRLGGALHGKHSIAVGPGLGRSPELLPLLQALARHPAPQVWDADALNWLAEHPARLSIDCVLTPHPGEAARLLNCDAREVARDPMRAAEALHARYGAVALVKGATTAIAGAGRRALDISGSPGMATGGSGDVLTGIIAALLAGGLPAFDAAQAAALLHGRAGEAAAKARGVRSMTAMDLLDHLRIE